MNDATDGLSATITDTLSIATWNQPRSLVQLRTFISNREEALDVEEFDF